MFNEIVNIFKTARSRHIFRAFQSPVHTINAIKYHYRRVSESDFLVKDGLNNGELIVTAGTHVLNEGQKVRRFIETSDLSK